MNSVAVKAIKRESVGQQNAKQLRKQDQVPCVVYGGQENLHVSVRVSDIRHLIYTPDFNIIDLEIDGTKHQCVIKDMQFHPLTDNLLHIDFLSLSDDRKVIVDLPITFTGTAAGVREGGKLMSKLRKLTVKCYPKDLIPEIAVDVTGLSLGKSIKIANIDIAPIEIMNNPAIPLASVEIPRALKSKASEEAKAAEGATEEAAEEAAE